MSDVLISREKEMQDSPIQRGEHSYVTTEAEIGVMCLQVKKCQELQAKPETQRITWNRSSPRAFKEHGPDGTLISNF